ncbi:MAG: acyltransferase [Nitrospirales bacterium]|nr:acyltransferase [Nitrospirales bacterium]
MKVGYFQFEPTFGNVTDNLDAAIAKISSIDCDLLVLPELAMTGYQFTSQEEVRRLAEPVPEGLTTQRFARIAEEQSIYIVIGLAERDGHHIYNSAVLVGPHGFLGVYRKLHLFFEETLFFSPGNTELSVWNLGNIKIGLMICFDWIYPEVARTLALKGADILCHPSNLVLPHCPDAMVTRCLENRVFSITANRVGKEARGGKQALTFIGNSEIVSPGGHILHRASPDQQELTIVDINAEEARNKAINPYNDLFGDRRSTMYGW